MSLILPILGTVAALLMGSYIFGTSSNNETLPPPSPVNETVPLLPFITNSTFIASSEEPFNFNRDISEETLSTEGDMQKPDRFLNALGFKPEAPLFWDESSDNSESSPNRVDFDVEVIHSYDLGIAKEIPEQPSTTKDTSVVTNTKDPQASSIDIKSSIQQSTADVKIKEPTNKKMETATTLSTIIEIAPEKAHLLNSDSKSSVPQATWASIEVMICMISIILFSILVFLAVVFGNRVTVPILPLNDVSKPSWLKKKMCFSSGEV